MAGAVCCDFCDEGPSVAAEEVDEGAEPNMPVTHAEASLRLGVTELLLDEDGPKSGACMRPFATEDVASPKSGACAFFKGDPPPKSGVWARRRPTGADSDDFVPKAGG